MKTQTLASAFRTALARGNRDRDCDSISSPQEVLVAALQRSATGKDAIVQRRIGLTAKDTPSVLQ